MTHEEFVQILYKANLKSLPVGIILLINVLFFGATDLGLLGHVDATGHWVLRGIFGFSLLMLLILLASTAITRSQIQKGTYPLLKAIKTGDRSFVAWYYEHRTIVVNQGPQPAVYRVRIHTRTGKRGEFVLKGTEVPAVFAYLHQHFPDAIVGYSKEKRAEYRQRRR